MPPAAVRRPLTVTAWIGLSMVCLVLAPLLLAVAAIAAVLTRRPQPLILARLVIAYFARELAVLIACAALWLASGAGVLIRSHRYQMLHYALLRWFVDSLAQRALSSLEFTLAPKASTEATRALEAERPLLFFSRHAGPGDTVLLTVAGLAAASISSPRFDQERVERARERADDRDRIDLRHDVQGPPRE